MKKCKLLTLALSMLTVTALASCGGTTTSDTTTSEPTTSENPTSETTSEVEIDVESAADYVYQLYKNSSATSRTSTTTDYTVVSTVTIAEVTYSVSWEVQFESGVEGVVSVGETADGLTTIKVSFDANNTAATNYKLIATVSYEGAESVSKTFTRVVPEFVVTNMSELAGLLAAGSTDIISVRGVITATSSLTETSTSANVYLQDETGGAYAYGLTLEKGKNTELAVGNTIVVSGTLTSYNGQVEFAKGCTYQLVSSETQTVEATDITTAVASASSNKDSETLDKYQNMLVKITGATMGTIDESSAYYYFTLGNVTTYIRPSSSMGIGSEAFKALADVVDWKSGYIADFVGLVNVYGGGYYLTPVGSDCVTITERTLSDADKVAAGLEEVKVYSNYYFDTEVTLPLTNEDGVAFTYEVTGDGLAFDATTGKLTVTRAAEATTGSIKVTGTLNEATDSKTLEVTVHTNNVPSYTVAEAVTHMAGFSDKYIEKELSTVTGVVKSASYNSKHKSFTVVLEGDTTFTLYSVAIDSSVTTDYASDASALVGKTVSCTGFLQLYGTTYEMPYINASSSPTGAAFTPAFTVAE
jgi:hypothetical protein